MIINVKDIPETVETINLRDNDPLALCADKGFTYWPGATVPPEGVVTEVLFRDGSRSSITSSRFFVWTHEDDLTDIIGYKLKPAKTITLTLNAEQAVALRTIFTRIGGHPDNTLRGYVYDITTQLRGVPVVQENLFIAREGALYFAEGTRTSPNFRAAVKEFNS